MTQTTAKLSFDDCQEGMKIKHTSNGLGMGEGVITHVNSDEVRVEFPNNSGGKPIVGKYSRVWFVHAGAWLERANA